MQLALKQLAGHLAQGLRPLYTLHGDEPLQLQEAADAIRAAARAAGYTERSVLTVQGAHFDWSAVLAAGSALSLFADKQIVELRIPSGKPGAKKGSAALAQLAPQAAQAQDTLTLVTLPRLDAASKKSAWFTALDAHGIHIPIQPIERDTTARLDCPAPPGPGPAGGQRAGGAAHPGVFCRPGRRQPAGRAPRDPEAGPAATRRAS